MVCSLRVCGKQVGPPAVCSGEQGVLGPHDLAEQDGQYLAEQVGQCRASLEPARKQHFKQDCAKPISTLCQVSELSFAIQF